MAEAPNTEVVPLPAGEPIDWTPRRKVWVGATAGALATAVSAIVIWVMKEKGINIPPEVSASGLVLLTSLFTVAASFISSYWVTEPPTLPASQRVVRDLVQDGHITKVEADAALRKAGA